MQASPRTWVAAETGEAMAVKPGRGVTAAPGVVLKDTVGSTLGSIVGNAKVGRSWGVFVGAGVFVAGGMASAVWVNCAENCATVVPTMAVLMALTSRVGDGAAPTLQAESINAAVSNVMLLPNQAAVLLNAAP